MANEWNAVTVGDIFDLVNGYAFKSADFINSGVPVIKIKNVKQITIYLPIKLFKSKDAKYSSLFFWNYLTFD